MKHLYDALGTCILILGILWIVSQSGCNPVEATIGCPNVNKYESREGVYNANNFPIGRVLYLDSMSMQAFELGDVAIPNDSLKTTDTVKVVDQQVKVDFDFSFAGSVDPQVKEQIKAGLSILAAQEFNFTLYNVERKYAPNAIDWANGDKALLTKISDLHKHKPNLDIIICFVSGLVYADSLRVMHWVERLQHLPQRNCLQGFILDYGTPKD